MALFDAALGAMDDAGDGDLVFANFVDFDTLYGHRRDIAGYAAALEAFDRRLPEALAQAAARAICCSSPPTMAAIRPGAAPTTRASACRSSAPARASPAATIGLRRTFADIGETVAEHLGLAARPARRLLPCGDRRPCLSCPRSKPSGAACSRCWRARASSRVEARRPDLRFPFPDGFRRDG